MADQATLRNGRQTRRGAFHAVRKNLGDLGHDIIMLLELQAELFRVDAAIMLRRSIIPAVLAAVGLLTFLACFLLALQGVAGLVAEAGDLSLAAAQLLTAAAGAAVSLALVAVAGLWFRKATSAIERSRRELRHNIEWVKTALRCQGSQDELQI